MSYDVTIYRINTIAVYSSHGGSTLGTPCVRRTARAFASAAWRTSQGLDQPNFRRTRRSRRPPQETASDADLLTEFRPQPLARVEVTPSLLDWPDTAEGRELAAACMSFELCLFQVGRLRGAIAVLRSPEETFVAWLSTEVTVSPRDDGFVDDEDAALAEQSLLGKLNAALDLTWMEKE